jgi:hypothetical protein
MLARKSLRTAAAVRIAAADRAAVDRAAAAVSIAAADRTLETPHPASPVVGEGAPAALSHTTGETKKNLFLSRSTLKKRKFSFSAQQFKPLSPSFFRYNLYTGDVKKKCL